MAIYMRVIFTGGGTGGHLNPAIAIADAVKRIEPNSELLFVGTSRGIENKLVPAAGYKLEHVEIQGLRRSLSLSNIKTLWMTLTSPGKAKKIIREFKPDIAVGTGGFVCWPVIKAASEMGIPTALHESNALPGVAVKMLERYVDIVFTNFEESAKYLHHPEKVIRVGNPLRGDFSSLDYKTARDKLGITGKYRTFILSCGGSMGAERINDEVLAFMRDYIAAHRDVLHIHASGAIEYEAAKAKFAEYGLEKVPNAQLVEYIYDMPLKMAAADLVINRAGAITLSELALLGKPALIIPSPNVTDNHQYKNAKVLADAGAAVMLQESELAPGVFTSAVENIIGDRMKLASMQANFNRFATKNADLRIYEELKKLVNSHPV
jgi:undecaprenyldiphospho-muramoylpentapeptide beta-N-acetylglucosaminyltransferase